MKREEEEKGRKEEKGREEEEKERKEEKGCEGFSPDKERV